MTTIDDAIGRVEELYTAVTGLEAPPIAEPCPIPAERDPGDYVAQQLDRLYEMIASPSGNGADVAPAPIAPNTTTWETETDIVVAVELPGVSRDSLAVELTQGVVSIVAARKPPVVERARVVATTRPYAPFRAHWPAPPGTIPDAVEARLRDGLLELRFTKRTMAEESRSVSVD